MAAPVIEPFCCPHCSSPIDCRARDITCQSCGRRYPRLGAIPILLANPDEYLSSYCEQIALFEHQAALTVNVVAADLRTDDGRAVRALARSRGERIIAAVERQVADVRAILEPVLPCAWPERASVTSAEGLPGPLRHIHYLYRDWGWPAEPEGENERAIALVEAVLSDTPIGRTVVLGAGACRLAYDLHRRCSASETIAIDLDPLLLTVAQTVISGGTVSIAEANAEIDELEGVERQWMLAARDGPLDPSRFHVVVADALGPPLVAGAFDTVVTPWFIDVVPPDIRDFIGTVYALLRPGGRWLNVGPLRYSNHQPASLRFTREEVFELAELAGFRIDAWRSESQPYLVSRLSHRGRIEWVLAFAASRSDGTAPLTDASGGIPWLLFNHLPVPPFAGQSSAGGGDPMREAVLSAIDGRRTLNDLAAIVRTRTSRPNVSTVEIREAVRRYLAEIHPAARAAR